MRIAILFSGGKDSNYVTYLSKKLGYDIKCLLNINSKNKDSFMFQETNENFLKLQSELLNIPIHFKKTKGEKEKELKDLKELISFAKKKYDIEGVISGAINSIYQNLRIERICDELDLFSINPIWQIDEEFYFNELLKNNFEVKIVKIASFPFDKNILGKNLSFELLNKFKEYKDKFKISLIGEGGEFETLVTYNQLFGNYKICMKDYEKIMLEENLGFLKLKLFYKTNKI